jgi:hypothetical protein
MDIHEPVHAGVIGGAQDDSPQGGVHGDVETQAERQRYYGNHGESGAAAQCAQGVTEIAGDVVEHPPSPHLPAGFVQQRGVAELAAGGAVPHLLGKHL